MVIQYTFEINFAQGIQQIYPPSLDAWYNSILIPTIEAQASRVTGGNDTQLFEQFEFSTEASLIEFTNSIKLSSEQQAQVSEWALANGITYKHSCTSSDTIAVAGVEWIS
jgi:hypothetical protein